MYTDFFGLREHPFNVTPDPRFFYANPVNREAYASLLLAIRGRKGFAVMVGEVGTGKTTLLRMLMDNLEATTRFVYLYNTRLSFDELLTYTGQELGLPTEGGRLARITALNRFLIEQLRRGGTAVLFIDEAQNLDSDVLESLRLLSNLETSTEKLLQIILVGQPEFEVKLAEPSLRQLAQRVPARCRLHPLSPDEVGHYIAARLRTAGYEGRDLFSDGAVRRIAASSGGIPRVINILCDNTLQVAYASSKNTVSPAMVDEVSRELRLAPPNGTAAAAPHSAASRSSAEPSREARLVYAGRRPRLSAASAGIGALVAGVVVGGTVALVSWPSSLSVAPPEWAKSFTGVGLVSERMVSGAPSFGTRPATADSQEPPTAAIGLDLPERPNFESPPAPAASATIAPSERVLVSAGTTIANLAFERYGGHYLLGMDLIKEVNPHLDDLDVVMVGEALRVPSLNGDTLIRKHSDGSFELILGSHLTRDAAEGVARSPRRQGYEVEVTPRRLTRDRVVYRVTIIGLKSKTAADRAWVAAIASCWNVTPAGRCEGERDG